MMFKTLWGDWSDGRLDQKPYILWMGLTILAFFALMIGVGVAAGVIHVFFTGLYEHYQAGEARGLAILAFVGFVTAMIAIGLAQLNLVIKRGRDTGLPGLWVGVAYLAFLGFGGALVMAIILAFVPTGQFAKTNQGE